MSEWVAFHLYTTNVRTIRVLSKTSNLLEHTLASLPSFHHTESSLRLCGVGTMPAVSGREEASCHWVPKSYGESSDHKANPVDFVGYHYLVISVLGFLAILHIPELGCSIPMKPGDVIGFRADR